MAKYIIDKRDITDKPEKASYIDGSYIHDFVPYVSDHVYTDTGLVDKDGNAIMRMPNPIGFVWGD